MAARGRPRDQAARERIVAAATEQFTREGYVATTIGTIASRAEVAVKTVYAAYGNKCGLLSAVHDRAVLGEGEPAQLLDHAWVRSLSSADAVRSAWAEAAARLADSTARAAPVMSVIQHAAADPEVAQLLAELRRQRYAFSLGLARILCRLPGATAQSRTRVADVLYATMTAESYTLFVTERGWTLEQWRAWAQDTIARELTVADPVPTDD